MSAHRSHRFATPAEVAKMSEKERPFADGCMGCGALPDDEESAQPCSGARAAFDRKVFGARLREERRRRGISARVLGERIDQMECAVCHWERGTHAPSLPNLVAVCAALGVSPDVLLGWRS